MNSRISQSPPSPHPAPGSRPPGSSPRQLLETSSEATGVHSSMEGQGPRPGERRVQGSYGLSWSIRCLAQLQGQGPPAPTVTDRDVCYVGGSDGTCICLLTGRWDVNTVVPPSQKRRGGRVSTFPRAAHLSQAPTRHQLGHGVRAMAGSPLSPDHGDFKGGPLYGG